MLIFAKPAQLLGDNLAAEITAAGYSAVEVYVNGSDLVVDALTSGGNPITEQSRIAIQNVIDAHTGQPTADQQKPLTVQSQLEAGITQMKTELGAWPADLAAGATLNQVGARVNLISAQTQRNTERLLWLAQKLLNRFE